MYLLFVVVVVVIEAEIKIAMFEYHGNHKNS